MADLSEIKVGDRLRLEALVASVDGDLVGLIPSEDGAGRVFLGGRWIEAAEHIPAPKTFKRGQFVRHINPDFGTGLVICPTRVNFYKVHFDGERFGEKVGILTVAAEALTEAHDV